MIEGSRPRAPRVMGIINVTPDSFSDGGRHDTTEAAVAHGVTLLEQGADILDIGGESTRPGATRPLVAEELDRVVPVIRELAAAGAAVSVDTMRAVVAVLLCVTAAHAALWGVLWWLSLRVTRRLRRSAAQEHGLARTELGTLPENQLLQMPERRVRLEAVDRRGAQKRKRRDGVVEKRGSIMEEKRGSGGAAQPGRGGRREQIFRATSY